MTNRPGAPLFATVNVTGVCNLTCRYCFFQPRLEHPMAWPDFERVIRELGRAQVFFVNLSGGEPFTHPEIGRILEHAHEAFEHVVTLTNGTLIRPRHLATIAGIVERKGAFPIQVSLDAVEPEINERTRSRSDRVLANLERLAEVGANLVIAVVVSRANVATVEGTIRELAALTRHFHVMGVQPVRALAGADSDLALPQAEMARVWERLREVREELDLVLDTPADEAPEQGCACGAPCMAAFTHLVIDPDLRVRPCDRLVDVTVGDLRCQTLAEIWHGPGVRPMLESPVPYCRRPEVAAVA